MAQQLIEVQRSLVESYENGEMLSTEELRNMSNTIENISRYIIRMNASVAAQSANDAAEYARLIAERGREIVNNMPDRSSETRDVFYSHFSQRHITDLTDNQEATETDVAQIRPVAQLRPRPTGYLIERARSTGRRSPLATLPKKVKLRDVFTCRTLAKAVLAGPCTEPCSICVDTHTKGDSLMTDCGHEFGRECWNNWMTSTNSNHCCPICRKKCPKVTVFKARSAKIPRTVLGIKNI